tara:strand:- start:193 stop:471 length:279 start_codon:yes stop_codon:yes gene_type:complete
VIDLNEMAREFDCTHMLKKSPATADDYQVAGAHYTSKTVQPWEYMEAIMPEEQFEGYIRGNIIKYISRYPEKGGKIDVEKARHYIDKLLELL